MDDTPKQAHSTRVGRWTPGEINAAIDALLEMQSEAAYKGELDRLAKILERGLPDGRPDGDVVERFIWGLCVRLTEYTPPKQAPALRTGPATWAEQHFIQMATATRSREAQDKRKAPPDARYLSPLLRRSIVDAMQLWEKYGPSRGRGAGFGVAAPGTKEPKPLFSNAPKGWDHGGD